MGGDAIEHLQVLVEQQAKRFPEDKHADVYLWLGNLLMDRGERAQALEAWSEGLRLFPSNQALRDRIDTFR